MTAALPTRVPGYRLLRSIGSGANGTVYFALNEATGTPVALKCIALQGPDAEQRARRFANEAEASQRLIHPDIVRTLAHGIHGPLGWLALEWVQGSDLSRYTLAQHLLPERIAVAWTARLARALHHAHEAGVLHRDIKPHNVRVNLPADVVKLGDFGLAKAVAGAAASEATGTGMLLGTPAYMAPEQLGGADADPRSELYALGVVLHELLTGRPPFAGLSMGEFLQRISREPPPDVRSLRPRLPQALAEALSAALAPAPAQRPPSAAAWAAMLEGVQSSLG